MSSVRRVGEYSSSFLDVMDRVRWEIRDVHRGIAYPSEVINHHAPLTPSSTQSTGLFKRAAYSEKLQTGRGAFFYRRVFRGGGAKAKFRAILN